MSISSQIPSYPPRNTPRLSYELAKRGEIGSLKMGPTESVKDKNPGDPLISQELQRRILSPESDYTEMLLAFEVGTGKCVFPDTVIPTDKGLFKIEDLYDNFGVETEPKLSHESWATLGVEELNVWSYSESKEISSMPVSRLYKQYIKEKIVELILDDGSRIKLTKAHHLFNGKSWTNKFRKGGVVCVPKFMNFSHCSVDVKSNLEKYVDYESYTDFLIQQINQEIPEEIIYSSENQVRIFLKKYFQAKGFIRMGHIIFPCDTLEIFNTLSLILKRFGLWLKLDFGSQKTAFLHIKDSEKFLINIMGCEDLGHSSPMRNAEMIISVNSEDLNFAIIKDIKYVDYEGYVYDLEVPITHNYVANNILCHNTCSASLIVENFKNILVDGMKRKPALVLFPNEQLILDFKNQVAERCTSGDYIPKLEDFEAMSPSPEGTRFWKKKGRIEKMESIDETVKRRTNALIAETYEMSTYEKFFMKRSKGETVRRFEEGQVGDDRIKNKYSNRIIIMEEAHNIKAKSSKGKEELDKTLAIELHRFLHKVENCRKILLTGTPIWDSVYEISGLMNLILPESEQLPVGVKAFEKAFFGKNGELNEHGLKTLRNAFRGRVSYLRSTQSEIKKNEIGMTEPFLKFSKIFPTVMSPFQEKYALEARIESEGKTKDSGIQFDPRDAMNMVMPVFSKSGKIVGGKYGSKSFKEVIKFDKTTDSYTYSDKYSDQDILRITNDLQTFSNKFASALDIIENNPGKIVHLHFENVKSIGGAIHFAMLMERKGYIWAKNLKHIAKPPSEKEKGKRFTIISSADGTINNNNEIGKVIDSRNKPDNKYGDRLRILISTKKLSEGVTLKNTRIFINMMPHWNLSRGVQAMGRVYRVGTHGALPEKERTLDVYRFASVVGFSKDKDKKKDIIKVDPGFPGDGKAVIRMIKVSDARLSENQSADIHIYRMAEEKMDKNTQVIRLLKEMSWDCPETYRRNVLESDVPGSIECNNRECNYVCDGYPSKYISKKEKVWDYITGPDMPENKQDNDLKNKLYSEDILYEMIYSPGGLIKLFQSYSSMGLECIIKQLEIQDKQLLIQALDRIIDKKIIIRNRYGFACYLQEQNNNYFLTTSALTENYSESVYNSSPFVTDSLTLEDVASMIQYSNDVALIDNFCNNPEMSVLEQMGEDTIILLFEYAYSLLMGGKKLKPHQQKVVKVLEKYFKVDSLEKLTEKDSSGKVIHSLYVKNIGLGYFTKKDTGVGKTRMFDLSLSGILKWRTIQSIILEQKKEEEEIEQKKPLKKEEVKLPENPTGVYGFLEKKTNKLKIYVPGKGGKGTRAQDQNVVVIWTYILDIDYLPEPLVDYEDHTREDIRTRILNQKLDDKKQRIRAMAESSDTPTETLKRILTLMVMKPKNRLVELLKEGLEKRGYMIEDPYN